MPAWGKFGAVVASLTICTVLERYFPLFRWQHSRRQQALVNLGLFVGVSAVNLGFGVLLVAGLNFFQQFELGLLFWLPLPAAVEILISVLLLDLIAQYAVHVCLHKVGWMWRLHQVHHSDTHLDATSGTRHHPLDYALREVFSFVALVVLGIPVGCYFLYRFLTIFFTYVNHANIRVAPALNRILSLVFVTPDVHKIHHHFELPWTDRNYGNIFSFWDRIFGTLVQADPTKVRYGLDSLGLDYAEGLVGLLKSPWKRQ